MRFVAFFFSFFLFLTITPQVYAHVIKEDGVVGAILHIHPNDEPIAGEESEFVLNFKDKTNKFSSEVCNCTVVILQNGKEIFSKPLFQGAEDKQTGASFKYTFPQKDVYLIQVTGEPFQNNDFQPFKLEYDVRVDRGSDALAKNVQELSLIPVMVGIAIGLSLVAIIVRRKNERG